MNAALQDAPPMHSGLRFGTPAGAASPKPCAVAFARLLTDTQSSSSLIALRPVFFYFHVLGLARRADNTPLSIYLTLACNRVFQYASTRLPVSSFSSHTTKPCAMSESHQRPDGRRRSRLFKLRLVPLLLPLEPVCLISCSVLPSFGVGKSGVSCTWTIPVVLVMSVLLDALSVDTPNKTNKATRPNPPSTSAMLLVLVRIRILDALRCSRLRRQLGCSTMHDHLLSKMAC